MFGLKFKYYDWIEAEQEKSGDHLTAPAEPFDITPFLTKSRLAERFGRWTVRNLIPAAMGILRRIRPVATFGRLVIVTRDADVRDVLSNHKSADDEETPDFCVPYGLEMTELAANPRSVLGLDGSKHDELRQLINDALTADTVGDLAKIGDWSRGYAEELIMASDGSLDVVTDLITRCATETCCRYFGLSVNDPVSFAHWTIAVSNMLFASPFGGKKGRKARELALNAAPRIRAVLEDACARAREYRRRYPDGEGLSETLVGRFVKQGMKDKDIIATLMGLATGFIPTNTLAAGNMLEELLAQPDLLREATRIAEREQRDADATRQAEAAMRQVLLKAARLNSPLSPGQWRYARHHAVIDGGRPRPKKIRKDSVVLASTMSAMLGGSAEDPEKAAELIFGWGSHSCLGREIAMAQIVPVFMALLAQPGLAVAKRGWLPRRAWMQRLSVFPIRLNMTFTSATAGQTMIIVCAPLAQVMDYDEVKKKIAANGNPARGNAAARTLEQTGIVHFCSVNVIEEPEGSKKPDDKQSDGTKPGRKNCFVLLEINADGPGRSPRERQDAVLKTLARDCYAWLGPIFTYCHPSKEPIAEDEFAAFLVKHALDLRCVPWGATGLHYNGTEEFSVEDIKRQEKLANFASKALNDYFAENIGRRGRAMEALVRVRRLIKQDSFYKSRKRWSALREESVPFQFSLARPSGKRLSLVTWQPPKSFFGPLKPLARSRDGTLILSGLALSSLTNSAVLIWFFGIGTPAFTLHWIWHMFVLLAGALLGGALATVALGALIAGMLVGVLRLHEKRDKVDERAASFARMREIAAREDAPGYEQNHILAVVELKPGLFRRCTFAFGLWVIKQLITFWFRPGFVVKMGTIHYAKWFRVPGTRAFVFLSNYDGSWESYLEDFITRAHQGQTAAWSNGVGFPQTKYLFWGGADDGDHFKRWVRLQQRPTQFWYSRFPHLTTRQIRNHAIIEDGLVNAISDTDATRWLGCFGSAQREEEEIESSEVQSIVFSGFGKLNYATCLVLQLPPRRSGKRLAWLKALTGAGFDDAELAKTFGQHASWFEGPANRLHRPMQVAFGDYPILNGASVLGFSSRGLRKLGLAPKNGSGGGLAEFPAAFNFGMGGRSRMLGDTTAPDQWRWKDTGPEDAADAVLVVYGQLGEAVEGGSNRRHCNLVERHISLLEQLGGKILHQVPTRPVDESNRRLDVEHFGFHDGISQPIIRGTQRNEEANTQDLVEPGELILGYPNNQKKYAPPIWVTEESDYRNDLPTLDANVARRFPVFGGAATTRRGRDFARNGTFLVVRQLDQFVDDFHKATASLAGSIRARYHDAGFAAGHPITAEWVAAKMVGRWQDGTPLVGHPAPPDAQSSDKAGNAFLYGTDDPRGHHCPMGAHIRRANPRDSFEPGDPTERMITDRHRLLRRGRSYCYSPDPDKQEKRGLLFMALCSDIERQFEFVQHSWIDSGSFHGLVNERDPIASDSSSAQGGTFTIPTPAGPIVLSGVSSFVQMRAGGYFFVPSLSACKYLCSLDAGPKEREFEPWGMNLKTATPAKTGKIKIAEDA